MFLPPLLLPDGVTELVNQLGGAALLVDGTGPRSPLWRTIRRLAGPRLPRLVVMDQPSDDAARARLKVLLERLRLRGEVLVVVASRLTAALGVVGEQFGVPIVHQAAPPKGHPAPRLGNVWAVTSPRSRRAEHYGDTLTEQVIDHARELALPAPTAPPLLALWLDAWARGDREGSATILADHLKHLTSEAVTDWLAEIAQRTPGDTGDPQLHDAIVRLARRNHADLAYRFLAASDVAARVEATFSVAPVQLPDVSGLLGHLGRAAAATPADRANAAVLQTLHEILAGQRPNTNWFPANIIKHLAQVDRLRWDGQLSDLTGNPLFSPDQHAALSELRRLTLTC
ncbi:hypothetical protein ACQEVZ_39830 [Dactylosporangium sp. CA-152071]|uniref:hypothetical protein n=1 Tax=Dactylosporangium sp. CA-152071 TaxID=3239933 RepID=UPI003D89EB64